jgi:serine/threonine protein kinase
MAPEVGRKQPYNEFCDVYSFGVLVWEMMALKKPYGKIDMAGLVNDVWKAGPDAKRPSPSLVEKGSFLTWRVWKGTGRRRYSNDEIAETVFSPVTLQSLLASCWSDSLDERPRMSKVANILREELNTVRKS